MPGKYKLSYFDIKGFAEPIRFLLSYGGIAFEDHRIDKNTQWAAIKPTTPFGQVPVLDIDGKKITQSNAICRYLGKQFKICGKDDWEALQIDIAVDTFADFRSQIGAYHYDADAVSKAAKKEVLFKETLPYYLTKFEAMVKTNGGYFVGGQLSWADIFWTAMGGYIQTMLQGVDMTKDYPSLKALETKVLAIPSVKAWVDKRPKGE